MQDPLLLDLKKDKKIQAAQKAMPCLGLMELQTITTFNCQWLYLHYQVVQHRRSRSVELSRCYWTPKTHTVWITGFYFHLGPQLKAFTTTKGVLRWTIELLPLIWKKSSPSCLRWFCSAHHSTVSKDKHLIQTKMKNVLQKGHSTYMVPIKFQVHYSTI